MYIDGGWLWRTMLFLKFCLFRWSLLRYGVMDRWWYSLSVMVVFVDSALIASRNDVRRGSGFWMGFWYGCFDSNWLRFLTGSTRVSLCKWSISALKWHPVAILSAAFVFFASLFRSTKLVVCIYWCSVILWWFTFPFHYPNCSLLVTLELCFWYLLCSSKRNWVVVNP